MEVQGQRKTKNIGGNSGQCQMQGKRGQIVKSLDSASKNLDFIL